jgi:hypothetical protein
MGKKFNDHYPLVLFSYWKQGVVQNGGVSTGREFLNFLHLDDKLLLLVQRFPSGVPRHVGMGPEKTSLMTNINFT